MKKDEWGKTFEKESKNSIEKFTSVRGFMPFSLEGFKVVTKWVNDKDKKILEAGCGSGRYCIELAKRYPKSKIIGVDISRGALRISKLGAKDRKIKNVKFKKGNIFKLPFKDNHFDVVFNKGVIEHFNNYKKIIEEMARVTKKNGKVIIAVPNKLNIIHPLAYYYHKNIMNTFQHGMEIHFTPKKLKEGFNAAKLKNLEQDGMNPFYRLAKFIQSENIVWKIIQKIFKIIAIILHYIITKPLDFLTGHKISKYFGWEIVVMGKK